MSPRWRDWMGAVSIALKPMVGIIEAHVLAAQRLHVDDTPVPVLAKGKTRTGRRRKFYEIAALKKTPIAVNAVTRIDAIVAIERTINASTPAVRDQTTRSLVSEFIAWLNGQRRTLSPTSDTAKAMEYGLKRMPAFARFLDDGRICLSNYAAERAMRCIAIGPSHGSPTS